MIIVPVSRGVSAAEVKERAASDTTRAWWKVAVSLFPGLEEPILSRREPGDHG